MITLHKLYQPTFTAVSYLSKIKGTDDATLSELLRACVINSEFGLYEFKKDNTPVGAAVIKIVKPILYIWLAGAEDFFNWNIEGRDVLEQEAHMLGCTKMKFYGRLGWLRKPPDGWKAKAIEFVREIP